MTAFRRQFAPFAKGRLRTPSRLAILPHGTAMVREGNLTEEDVAYYAARATPGVGLVVAGAAIASPSSSLKVRNLLEAWEEGTGSGIAPELMAYAALYTALTDLVAAYGEDQVAVLADGLRARVMKGEFTLPQTKPQ